MMNELQTANNLQPLAVGARLMLTGGLALVVGGLITGELFALLLSHAINAQLQTAWFDVLEHTGKGGVNEIVARFDDIHRLAIERARAMSIHSHAGPYGLLAAALALFKTRLGTEGRFDLLAAVLIIVGGLFQSAGFLWLDYQTIAWLSLSNAGVLALLAGIGLYIPGLLPVELRSSALPRSTEAGGRLLRAGAFLVFAGLLFGLFLAWRHVFFEEPSLNAALHDFIRTSTEGNVAGAKLAYAAYKSTQIRMAITAASHSHAVSFGFIMILTALLAGHLRLTLTWRNLAYGLIAAGGLVLPVFVFLAPRYGYFYALCADTAGGLVILGLLIVLFGLIPKQGV